MRPFAEAAEIDSLSINPCVFAALHIAENLPTMWSFLVAVFGAFLYTALALYNAKVMPGPDQIRGETKAQSMVVFHVAARKVCEANPAACPNGVPVAVQRTSLPDAYVEAALWSAFVDINGRLITYSAGAVDDSKQFAWALAKYSNGNTIKTGWWNSAQKTCTQNATPGPQPCIAQNFR